MLPATQINNENISNNIKKILELMMSRNNLNNKAKPPPYENEACNL